MTSTTTSEPDRGEARTLSRRALLAAGPALALFALSRRARAEAPHLPRSRVVHVDKDRRGVTVTLELAHAPFPAPGAPYRDATVLAFIPRHFRPSRSGRVGMLVHYHGHHTTSERAIVKHQLREQLYDSKQNAILLVPELAAMARSSAAGKLESDGGFARMIADALDTLNGAPVRRAAGRSQVGSRAHPGRVCISAHSGGYHAAACSLRHGGLPVREVYLFDALYADVDVFRDWVIEGHRPDRPRHKLVSYYTGGTTAANTRALFAQLEKAGVACAHEEVEGTLSREQLTRSAAVSIRTRLSHGAVTSELNGLRDCLYASALHRHLRSSWFDAKQGARPLEHRRRRP